MYRQFARIFEAFRISETDKAEDLVDSTPKEPVKEPDLKKVPKLDEDFDDDEGEEGEEVKFYLVVWTN